MQLQSVNVGSKAIADYVSIAGRTLMSDDIPEEYRGQAARVHLDGDDIVISRL